MKLDFSQKIKNFKGEYHTSKEPKEGGGFEEVEFTDSLGDCCIEALNTNPDRQELKPKEIMERHRIARLIHEEPEDLVLKPDDIELIRQSLAKRYRMVPVLCGDILQLFEAK